jgi:hypothetical protein
VNGNSKPQQGDTFGVIEGFPVNLSACQRVEDRAAHLKKMADGILATGNPYQYFLDTFQLDHAGDLTAARSLILTFASSSVANGDGLNTYLSGSSGRGKSHTATIMFQQIPGKYNFNRSFSDRYLLYASMNAATGLSPGAVVLIDDQTMSPTIQELFKVAVSNFKDGVQYGTVLKQTAVDLKMPPRVAWVLLKVDDPGDDQVMNRLIQARIIEDDEKVKEAADMIQSKYHKLTEKNVKNARDEVVVCQHMWNWLKENMVAVECPCAGYVRFGDYHNLRNHEIFFNMMMAHATIFQQQRKIVGETIDGIKIIEASKEDYKEAKYIFEALHRFGGQKHNTIKNEDLVIKAMLELQKKVVTMKDIAGKVGLQYTSAYRALHGRRGKDGNILGGLLDKCPYIQKADKRGRYEMEMEHNYTQGHSGGTTEIIRKESYNEDIYEIDISGLESWSGIGELVSLPHSFKWENPDGKVEHQ